MVSCFFSLPHQQAAGAGHHAAHWLSPWRNPPSSRQERRELQRVHPVPRIDLLNHAVAQRVGEHLPQNDVPERLALRGPRGADANAQALSVASLWRQRCDHRFGDVPGFPHHHVAPGTVPSCGSPTPWRCSPSAPRRCSSRSGARPADTRTTTHGAGTQRHNKDSSDGRLTSPAPVNLR